VFKAVLAFWPCKHRGDQKAKMLQIPRKTHGKNSFASKAAAALYFQIIVCFDIWGKTGSWFRFLSAGICCICWMQDTRLQMRLYFSMQLFDKWLSSNSEPILTFENMVSALMLYGEGMFIIKLFTSLNFRVSQLPDLHLGHWGK